MRGVKPFFNAAFRYYRDFVEKLGYRKGILSSLRSHALAVTLFPLFANSLKATCVEAISRVFHQKVGKEALRSQR